MLLWRLTGATGGTFKENLFQERSFDPLESRGWFRKLPLFYKIIKNESLSYLYHLIPKPSISHSTRNSKNVPLIKANHGFSKNTFSIYYYNMKKITFEYSHCIKDARIQVFTNLYFPV